MKKILFLLTSMIVGTILTVFVIGIQPSKDNHSNNNWVYYTSTNAWLEATESKTIYIYYKQGNGVRIYCCSGHKWGNDELWNLNYYGSDISENPLFREKNCNDFRRNYKYRASTSGVSYMYFNANLPYMEKR